MNHFHLFTDGSVNTKSKIGFGVYLLIADLTIAINDTRNLVKTSRFEGTSSTKLEIQTLLWALTDIMALNSVTDSKLFVYTDSQNIIGLPERRAKLERNHYLSSKNIELNNKQLYQEFYRLTDTLDLELIKVKGHKPSAKKNNIDLLFGIADQASRRALRNH